MLDTESDFGLRWLFNPNSTEFLPIEEQLKQYTARDLAKTKAYATATKLWGLQRSRKRVHIAPPMERHPGRDVNIGHGNAKLKPLDQPASSPPLRNDKDWALSDLEKATAHERGIDEKSREYKEWLGERMKLRDGLEGLRLNEQWLMNKPEPTPLERRVVVRMAEERFNKQMSKRKQDPAVKVEVSSIKRATPEIARPPPEAMAIIAKYLNTKRQRLIDLFTQADKDKSWSLTREEFQHCIKEAGIPISDQLLTELLDSLDKDFNEQIDFREFVHGMKYFRLDERKKVAMAQAKRRETQSDATNTTATPTSHPASKQHTTTSQRAISAGSSSSPTSMTSRSSSPYLTPPPINLSERRELEPDQLIEKRKRERHQSLLRTQKCKTKTLNKVRTGNPVVDSHSMRSTLGGAVAQEVNEFREARLKEYHDICKLCSKHGVDLTPKLLERALLHPGDKPPRRIRNHIRQPGTRLLSEHFADPPVARETPTKYHDPDKVVVTRSGELMMEAKHAYPLGLDVRPDVEMMNLSSGKALVSRKVDCWMTFEEYDGLTSHLRKRYVTLDGSGVDPNVFWPGQLLDKLCLCMPRGDIDPSTMSLFSSTRSMRQRAYPGHNNDLRWWPISDQGYMMPADYEQNKVYSVDPK